MSADPEPSRAPGRILLVRLGAVGDVIRTLPLLHEVRRLHPEAHLGWAVEEPSAGLLRALPALDAVHVLPRRTVAREMRRPWSWPRALARLLGFRRELREARYELVLDVHGTFKAALVARSAGAPRLVGFAPGGSKEGAALLYRERVPFPRGPMTRIRRAFLLGRGSGLLPEAEPAVEHGLRLPCERAEQARSFVRGRARPVAVLFPFASNTAKGRRKRWPLEAWAELAATLDGAGASVVVAWGSPGEGEQAREVCAEAGGSVVAAPPTDLVELAGLLEESDLLVTGDTGPMHLAAAVGTRCLALFGPSDPVINRPWGEGHEVLVHQPLNALPAGVVAEAAAGMLGLAASASEARR